MISDSKLQVEKFLDILANALAGDGVKIIKGNDEVFERMKTVRWWDFQPDALRRPLSN